MLFISHYKLSSFLRYLNFCPELFADVEKWFDKKAKISFKFMKSSNGKQIIIIAISHLKKQRHAISQLNFVS